VPVEFNPLRPCACEAVCEHKIIVSITATGKDELRMSANILFENENI